MWAELVTEMLGFDTLMLWGPYPELQVVNMLHGPPLQLGCPPSPALSPALHVGEPGP